MAGESETTEPTPLRGTLLPLALGAWVVAVVYAVFNYFHTTYIGDDAHMSFRYAQNLAAGRGLVFNPGERVWGFTSPLNTLLLALAGVLLPIPIAKLAVGNSLLLVVGSGLVVWELTRPYFSPAVRWGLAVFVLTFPPQLFFVGLETNQLIFLQLSFLLFLDRGCFCGAAFVASLCCLTRPDSLLLVVPLLLGNSGCKKVKPFLSFAVPGILWLLFAKSYYGQWLPNSFYAKKGLSTFWAYVRAQEQHLADHNFWLLRLNPPQSYWLRLPLPLLSLVPAFFRKVPPGYRYVFGVYPALLTLSYAVIGSDPGHNWEVYSAYFFCTLSAVVAILLLLGKVVPKFGGAPGAVVSLLIFSVVGVSHVSYTLVNFARLRNSAWEGSRHRTYQEIANWMRKHLEPKVWVAYTEPGTIAYLSDMKIFDLAHIVSPPRPLPPNVDYLIAQKDDYRIPNGVPFRLVHSFPNVGFSSLHIYQRDNGKLP